MKILTPQAYDFWLFPILLLCRAKVRQGKARLGKAFSPRSCFLLLRERKPFGVALFQFTFFSGSPKRPNIAFSSPNRFPDPAPSHLSALPLGVVHVETTSPHRRLFHCPTNCAGFLSCDPQSATSNCVDTLTPLLRLKVSNPRTVKCRGVIVNPRLYCSGCCSG